jgi:hypothetical protein
MALLGPRDTRQLVNLAGWDATELRNYDRQNNTSYSEVVAEFNAALGGLNAEIAADPFIASVASLTDRPESEYGVGGSNGFERHTEYGRPDIKRAAITGHMLPLKAFDRGLGWTWDFLRRADMSQVRADFASAITDARDIVRQQVLQRFLTRGDESGIINGLGAGGYSPGFATAAANTAVDFTPPQYGATTFTSDHEHYVGVAGGAFTTAILDDMIAELNEHGHTGVLDLAVGPNSVATIQGLTGFYGPASPLIINGSGVTFANVDVNEYIGVYKTLRIREVGGIPQYYGFAYKSYGNMDMRNPLKIRLPQGLGSLLFTAMTDPRAGNATTPIQYLMLFTEFGVGVNDRTAGTTRYVNNATWADGVAT